MSDDIRKKAVIVIDIVLLVLGAYLGGLAGAVVNGYENHGFFNIIKALFLTKQGHVIFIVFAVIALILFIAYKISSLFGTGEEDEDDPGYVRAANPTYGKARLLTEADCADKIKNGKMNAEITASPSDTDGYIFGTFKKSGNVFAIKKTGANNRNIAVCGPPGSGKSRGFVMNSIIQGAVRGSSMFMIDTKGELSENTAAYLYALGYKVRIFNLINMEASNCWDLLGEASKDKEAGDNQYIETLCNALISNASDGSGDQYYLDIATAALQAACLYICETESEENRTMGNVMDFLERFTAEELHDKFMSLRKENPYSDAVKSWLVLGNDKARETARTELLTKLSNLRSPLVRDIMSPPPGGNEIELTDLAKTKTAVFLVASDSDSTYNSLKATFINMMLIKIYGYADSHGNKCDVPVDLILDEFHSCGFIKDFSTKLSTARSRDIGITIIFQNIPQLKDRYPTQWGELLGDCDYNVCLGSNENETNEYYSKLSGTVTVEVESTRKDLATFRLTDYTPEYSSNLGDGKRPLINPEDVAKLHNEVLVFIKGHEPLKLNMMDFKFHPESLLLRKVKTKEIVPKWRINEKGEIKTYGVRTGEWIMPERRPLSAEEEYALAAARGKNIVEDSEEFGPDRANLINKAKRARGTTGNGRPPIKDELRRFRDLAGGARSNRETERSKVLSPEEVFMAEEMLNRERSALAEEIKRRQAADGADDADFRKEETDGKTAENIPETANEAKENEQRDEKSELLARLKAEQETGQWNAKPQREENGKRKESAKDQEPMIKEKEESGAAEEKPKAENASEAEKEEKISQESKKPEVTASALLGSGAAGGSNKKTRSKKKYKH